MCSLPHGLARFCNIPKYLKPKFMSSICCTICMDILRWNRRDFDSRIMNDDLNTYLANSFNTKCIYFQLVISFEKWILVDFKRKLDNIWWNYVSYLRCLVCTASSFTMRLLNQSWVNCWLNPETDITILRFRIPPTWCHELLFSPVKY